MSDSTESSSESSGKRPRQVLVEWANGQQSWVRAIVGELLATGQPLSEDSLGAAYQMSLVERGLTNEPAPTPLPRLDIPTEQDDLKERLSLTSIQDVRGVNSLAPNQEITFNPRLTILFGENAAGKSGYVRILKRIAAVRSAEPIIPNFRSPMNPSPHATLKYRFGTDDVPLEWNNEAGLSPFTRMCVFDNRAMVFHVDPDLEYVYTPRDLALFPLVSDALQRVKDRLANDTAARRPQAQSLLVHFDKNSRVYGKLDTLGPATDMPELEQMAALSDAETVRLQTLPEIVDALAPGTIGTQAKVAQNDADLFVKVCDAATVSASFDFEGYQDRLELLGVALEAHKRATAGSFEDSNVPAALGEEWRQFILSADRYMKSVGADKYPGDTCAYCRQNLSAAAVALIRKYHEYCNNTYQRQIDALSSQLKTQCAAVQRLDASVLRSAISTRLGTIDEAARPPALVKGLELADAIVDAQARFASRVSLLDTSVKALAIEVHALADKAAADSKRFVEGLAARGREREEAYSFAAQELIELRARASLGKFLPQIRDFVQQAKWCSKAETLLGRFQGLQRSLTDASKLASEDMLNQDFSQHFNQECQELQSPPVKLEFPGRSGQAKRKKVLAPTHRLSEILSEGEQRVIALADFLAEAAIRTNSAPIVFDDPVNSLDYKRLQHIVNRLARLSGEHQVIVFTHNIWFAMALLAKFEKRPDDCSFYDVARGEGESVGVITGGKHPRYDTPKEFRTSINRLIESAGNAKGEEQQALIERAYSRLRSWCEVVVEQELLCGVALRYQPNIMMGKLGQIRTERLRPAIDAISGTFEKCCRITDAHSQPLETQNIRTTLEELRSDWATAQAARDGYIADDSTRSGRR